MIITPVDSVIIATAWGAFTAVGIMVGALLGVFARLTHGVIARITSIGAGLLLAAASVELAAEVIKHSPYLWGGRRVTGASTRNAMGETLDC